MDSKLPHAFAVVLFLTTAVYAQDRWTGNVSVMVAGQTASGNEESFRSQSNLRSGVAFDDVLLQRNDLTFRASGFGRAMPSSRARLEMKFSTPLTLSLGYDRRDSFFALDDAALGTQRDDSRIERWNARLGWDGFRAGRWTLDLRRYSHSGNTISPFFALNERYPLRIDLNQRSDEAAIRFDSHGPVAFSFEQSFARQQRRDRTSPDSATAIGAPTDPELLLASSSGRSDVQKTPTSRASASFGGSRFEGAATMRWTPARLTSSLPVTSTFGVNGGSSGKVSFIDSIASSASRDAFAGNARVAFRLAPRWLLRVTSDYRDTSTDATLLGQRLVQMNNPDGASLELTAPLTGHTILSFTDASERVELERAGEHLTLRAGALASQRNIADVHRRSTGATLDASWRGARFFATAGGEHGSFEHYVFRTDPQKVDRFHLRGGTVPRAGWSVQAEARLERGDNPSEVARLAHRMNSGSLDFNYTPRQRQAQFGLSVGTTNLHTRTDLVLPGNAAGTSVYDLSLLTATAHGEYAIRGVRMSGSLTRLRDNGSTWPVRTWNGDARVMVRGPARSEIGVFGERWSYDESLAASSDFRVTRFGVLLGWRLQ